MALRNRSHKMVDRPIWPFRLNPASTQAKGLLYCGICRGANSWINLVTNGLDTVDPSLTTTFKWGDGPRIQSNAVANKVITMPTTTYLDATKPFTICWQIRSDSSPTSSPSVAILKATGGGFTDFLMFYSTNPNYTDFTWGFDTLLANHWKCLMPGGIPVFGADHFVVIAYDGSSASSSSAYSVWVNGIQGTVLAGNTFGALTPANIIFDDKASGGGSAPWNGSLKQFRIYATKRGAAFANAFYNQKTRWDILLQ